MRHELRLTWRNWWASTRMRGAWLILFYAFIAFWLLFAGFWAAKLLSSLPPIENVQALLAVSAVFAALSTLMLAQALILITDAIYQRGDLDLLLSSPIPAWRVLIVRMAAIAFNVAALYLILLGAVFVWLPLFGGWRWMGFAPSVLALALVMTALGLVIARGLFRLIGPRHTRVVAQVLASLIGAGIFLTYQFNNLSMMEERGAWFERMSATVLNLNLDPRSPIWIPARAAFGDPAALAIWLGLAIGIYALAVRWFAGPFVQNAAAIAGAVGRRKRDERLRRFRGGLSATLVQKEWRLLLRDPLLLAQILLPLLYFTPLVFVLWRYVGQGNLDRGALGAQGAALIFMTSMLAASLVWLTVSAEDAPDLIAASPVARDRLEHAKAFAAGAPVLALLLLPAIAAALIAPMAGVWLWIGGAASTVSTCLIGIWRQQPGSRKNFRRRARPSLVTNLGQLFVTLGWAAATAAAVVGWPLLGLIPALIALGLLLALHEGRDSVRANAA